MTTAILSALAEEQQGLREQLVGARLFHRAGREFWLGALRGQPVVLALSRIGKVAAATTATTLIEAFAVERIVFTGVAGALDESVHVGDLVVATEFVQHDMDASPLFPRFEVPLYQRSRFPCDAPLRRLLADAGRLTLAAHTDPGSNGGAGAKPVLHQGLIASGDRFVSGAQAAASLTKALRAASLQALAVEMEGAAVAQVCLDYGVPFAAVRTISDRADEQAPAEFLHFVNHVASRYALGIVNHLMVMLAPG